MYVDGRFRLPLLMEDESEDILYYDLKKISIYDSMIAEMLEALPGRMEEELKRQRILAQYDIKQLNSGSEAGTYYALVKGKKYQSNNKRTLEDKLIKISKEQALSFNTVFLECEEYILSRIKNTEKLASARETSKVHKRSYNRFIKDSFLENMSIDAITKKDLVLFLDDVTARTDLRKKAFDNLRIVLNKTFEFAIKKEYITTNPIDAIFWDAYKNVFVASTPIKERGYSREEIYSLREFALEMQYKHPEKIKWWSYEFLLLTAVRRAEVPPLMWTDVKKTHIDVNKELVGSVKPYTIKHSTKTGKDRKYPISTVLLDFLTRLHDNNEIYHPGSKFLFPDENEELGCITMHLTYRAHKYACKRLGIDIDSNCLKGTHAFRRVHETAFLEKGGGLDLASKVYGNSPRVVNDNYMLSVNADSSLQYIQSIHESLFCENKPVSNSDLLFG